MFQKQQQRRAEESAFVMLIITVQENEHSSLKTPSGQENDFSARQAYLSEFGRMQCRIYFNGKMFSKDIWKELREKLIEEKILGNVNL